MSSNLTLFNFVSSLQKEIENLCASGVSNLSSQQRTMLRNTQHSLSEMGAEFLATCINKFLEACEFNPESAPGCLFDLLTTVRVFERTLTLRQGSEMIADLVAQEESSADSETKSPNDLARKNAWKRKSNSRAKQDGK